MEDVSLSPVAGWTSGTVTQYGIAFIRFDYLVSPMESLAQAHQSPNFAMTVPQLRELSQRIAELAAALESGEQSSAGLPQH